MFEQPSAPTKEVPPELIKKITALQADFDARYGDSA